MNNSIGKNKKIGITILAILFFITFTGTIYFFIYNTSMSDTRLAHFFYFAAFLCFVAFFVYTFVFAIGINNTKRQLKESPSDWKRNYWAFIALVIGGAIINSISKRIGGQEGFTIGLILAFILILGYFGIYLFLQRRKNNH